MRHWRRSVHAGRGGSRQCEYRTSAALADAGIRRTLDGECDSRCVCRICNPTDRHGDANGDDQPYPDSHTDADCDAYADPYAHGIADDDPAPDAGFKRHSVAKTVEDARADEEPYASPEDHAIAVSTVGAVV
jgi:hypothetical protein